MQRRAVCTVADSVPEIAVVACDHRSRATRRPGNGVAIVAGTAVALVSAIATLPFASGFASTQCPPALVSRRACSPSGSWSMPIASRLPRIASVAGDASRRSVPISSGAAMIAHRTIGRPVAFSAAAIAA
jgi:hypothetical protein